MIEEKIKSALKKIPVVWPLQQLIAVNPLEDLNHLDVITASCKIKRLTDVQLTKSLTECINDYQSKTISDQAVDQAISEYCKKKQLDYVDLYQRLLKEFMLAENYQNHIVEFLRKQAVVYDEKKHSLLAYQLRPYFYDDPVLCIRNECLKWISNFFSQNNRFSTLLDKKQSLFDQWRQLMAKKSKYWRLFLSKTPDEPLKFIEKLLIDLKVPTTYFDDYLFQILWQLKGWAGYIKWQKTYPNNPWIFQVADVAEIIALWLSYENYWLQSNNKKLADFKPCYDVAVDASSEFIQQLWQQYLDKQGADKLRFDASELSWLWQRASEIDYENLLYQDLLNNDKQKYVAQKIPTAQWVFCIDVRSEGLRRHLESIAGHETFGFAGFFGFVYQLYNPNNQKMTCQCPALLEPSLIITMMKVSENIIQGSRTTFIKSVNHTKKTLLAPFALFEIVGLWFILPLLFKNYLVHQLSKVKHLLFKKNNNASYFKMDDVIESFGIENAVTSAKSLLQSLALTQRFSQIIVLCGHGATTENNPFQAALDCGACGGNAGYSNAIIACQILNHPEIRKKLLAENIRIPEETVFIAANHNTTTDKIDWFDHLSQLSDAQKRRIGQIKQDVKQAGQSLALERLKQLPGDKDLIRRSRHWAELIPEWGLANNAAMIIGPRKLSADLDLKRRVFLHSYDPDQDQDGAILEGILLGPLVVAYWINMQYYCSSIAPASYGSGNKMIHNVISSVGVIEGNQSDLKFGLPLQSVFFQEKRIHEPRRLFVIIYADKKTIEKLIKKHQILQKLIDGEWIIVKIIEP